MRRRRRDHLALALTVVAGCVGLLGLVLANAPELDPGEAPVEPSAIDLGRRHFALGLDYLRAGEPGRAVEAFEVARRADPHRPEVHVNLGYAYLAAGRPAAAKQAFATALSLRPAQANAYFGLAEAEERLGDLEAARGAMKTFVHLTPADDRFRRRALAALWEWEAAADGPRLSGLPPLPPIQGAIPFPRGYIGRWVALNVWATWCAPCRAELPSLERRARRLAPEQAIVGLSVDDDADFVREFLRQLDVRFANVLDAGNHVARPLLGVESLPQTLVFAPDGRLVRRLVGARDWDATDPFAGLAGETLDWAQDGSEEPPSPAAKD